MLQDEKVIKLAKKYIKKKPIPSSLEKQFKLNDMENLLEEVYKRTAQLIKENRNVNKEKMNHFKQILPSIAFYEVLLKKEKSKTKAIEIYEKWCFIKIEKMSKMIQNVLKIPGLYSNIPRVMKFLINKVFGNLAGFDYIERNQKDGFAVDMIVCPYVETCKKYKCPELAYIFCKSDDICYSNMHPKLVWGRTKTLARGGNCCDFKLWIKK